MTGNKWHLGNGIFSEYDGENLKIISEEKEWKIEICLNKEMIDRFIVFLGRKNVLHKFKRIK